MIILQARAQRMEFVSGVYIVSSSLFPQKLLESRVCYELRTMGSLSKELLCGERICNGEGDDFPEALSIYAKQYSRNENNRLS